MSADERKTLGPEPAINAVGEKIAVLTPIARAKVRTVSTLKVGLCRRVRMP